ncbi:MAG: iron-containing alcohol dehydrogenase [Oscillospiraceae bacterium]|nr:iron-containing alcohol dehydrogenase [Oscillospiraceae bacterium]
MYKIYCRLFQTAFSFAAAVLPWRRPERLSGFEPLAGLLKEKNIKAALLVTDKGLTGLDLHKDLTQALEIAGIRLVLYDNTAQNPNVANVEEAVTIYKNEKCAAIIALGGGSPMDCAKAVGARIARPEKSVTKMRGVLKVLKKIPPLIAIPTTAGTGSETTLAAVITDGATHEKYAINDPSLIPPYAVMEPRLTAGLPPHLTAWTGMDALCHAVEAYIGRSNTRGTRRDALKATELIFGNLCTAYTDGQNLEARKNMLEASFLAGAAFTRAYVGNIHSIAHTLGGHYGVQHGLANAVIMPYVLEAYGEKVYKRLSEMAAAADIADNANDNKFNAEKFIASIREMNAKMDIPDKIAELKEEDIPALAKRALKESNPLYPVPVIFGQGEMERIYRKVLG